jgi:alkylation response protein AidB-like acyl-CoA dehydrogenase
MLVPEEHGGMGFDVGTYLAALEALAWGEPAVALTLSIHSAFAITLLLRHGTEEQKARWLPELATGERIGCFALSEEGRGRTRRRWPATAERDGDGWVLTGEKKWVTNGRMPGGPGPGGGDRPDGGWGAEAGARGSDGLSAFLVPTDMDGWNVVARERTMGMRSVEVVTVRLDGLRLPADALLGGEGRGSGWRWRVGPGSAGDRGAGGGDRTGGAGPRAGVRGGA